MKFIRKHKKISIAILSVLILFLLTTAVFGRYIRNIIHNYILETKSFYFNSSILNINGKNYSLSNWDGFSQYPITIDLNNRKTDEIHTTTDILYTIEVDCPSSVQCALSKNEGILRPEDRNDSYVITITPVDNFDADDSFTFTTRVISTAPYRKVMSATYTVSVETKDFSYEIVDSPNSKFLTINFTNALSYYEVQTAFGEYTAGSRIGIDEYNNLEPVDQEKCLSAVVTVKYDPRILFVDMANKYYLGRLPDNYQEETIGGYQWVRQFSFKMNASSSSSINFYKDDITQDYSYPLVNSTSIIEVTPELANE